MVRYLRVAGKLPVHIEIETAVSSLETEYLPQSVRLVSIASAVHSHGYIVRHIGRVVWYRIAHVCVLRLVVAVKLPVRRNGQLCRKICVDEIVRHINNAVVIREIPLAVQQLKET